MTTEALVDTAPRVALLARQGAACERLQVALREAGAQIVLVSDPAHTDAAGVRNTGARAILIALEPAVEDALDRFDSLLADPAMTVIFDEADLAARREGWDAARWTRHLAAKLNRHQEVLPPGAEIDVALAAEPQPLAVSRRPHSDGDSSAFAIEATPGALELRRAVDPDASDGTPVSALDVANEFAPAFAGDVADAPAPAADGLDAGLPAFDAQWHASAMPTGDDGPLDDVAVASAAPAPHAASMFDPVLAEFDIDQPPDTPFLGELLPEPTRETPRDDVIAQSRFRRDLDDLHLRIADMQLENTRVARSTPTGAVIILAGIGGPDAVRQLLGELPASFPRPVLIQQRLEGGRHDKLVRQMQRATAMPVCLAEPGLDILGGHVYMLPADVGLIAGPAGLKFRAAAEESFADALFAPLSPAQSAVILLSGSDPSAVDAAMNHAVHGALVAGQSSDGCFDSVAASALVARGAEAGSPAQLARKLATRWPPDAIQAPH